MSMQCQSSSRNPPLSARTLTALFASLVLSVTAVDPAWAGSSVTTQLMKIQSGAVTKANGDFLSSNDNSNGTTGQDTYYSLYIEVPTGLANLNVELFDADFGFGATNDALRGANFNGSSTTYQLFNPAGVQVGATITGNSTGPAASNNAWLALGGTITNPPNGHWEVRVDATAATGDDVNGFGIRAYDGAGNAGASGTELPIYVDTMVQIGHIVSNSTLITRVYPWVTSDCSTDVVEFDFDEGGGGGLGGSINATNRLGNAVTLSGAFSANDVWASHTGANGDSVTNRNALGIWTSDITMDTGTPNNYGNVVYGATALSGSPTGRAPASSYRIYLPSDVGGAPRKPYISQYYIPVAGTVNPPANGNDTDVTVVVQVTNPTQRAITFSAANLVQANVPTNSTRVTYQGNATVTQGSVVTQPTVGSFGAIAWNPGSVAAGATAVLTFRVRYRPNNAVTVADLVGPFGTNGTSATWLDETGDAAHGRATYTFGQLCGMTITRGVTVPTPVGLASFSSRRVGGEVRAQWSTATETQNIGFRLLPDGLTDKQAKAMSLVPSRVVDSIEPHDYGASVHTEAKRLWLEDIDTKGTSKRHGPYEVGKDYGAVPRPEAIDWAAPKVALERASRLHAKSALSAAVLELKEEGIYRVSYEALASAGIDLAGVPAASIALSNEGQTVARRVGGTATFGPGSFVEFIGKPGTDLYGRQRSYLLSVDSERALDVQVDNAKPERVGDATFGAAGAIETQRYYSFASPNGDPWFADRMLAYRNTPALLPLHVNLPNRSGNDPVTVRLKIWGVTDWVGTVPDHQLNVLSRGAIAAEWNGDGLGSAGIDFEVRPNTAQGVDLELELTGSTGYDYDLVNLESLSVEYRAAARAVDGKWTGKDIDLDDQADGFAVSRFDNFALTAYRQDESGLSWIPDPAIHGGIACCAIDLPRGGANATYWVAQNSTVATPTIRALSTPPSLPTAASDYLIITHPLFASGVARLADHHRAEGLRVTTVDTDSIYRWLSDGAPKVQSIDDFIAYAVSELGVRYVLLVGGDTYDYDDNLGLGSISFIPTHYRMLNEQVRYAPTDAPYADVDDDLLPDVALGRLPVRTPADLDRAIDKLLKQSSAERSLDALFVAAAGEPGLNFSERATDLRTALSSTAGISSDVLSVDTVGVEGVRSKMQRSLQSGPALVTYIGHSGVDRWSYDPLLTAQEASELGNTETPSVFVQWGCWNTYFVSPYFNSMAHALLFGAGGASSVIGAAALTDSAGHQALGLSMYPALSSGTRLGDAMMQAKRSIDPAASYFRETSLGVNLLGDPAAKVF